MQSQNLKTYGASAFRFAHKSFIRSALAAHCSAVTFGLFAFFIFALVVSDSILPVILFFCSSDIGLPFLAFDIAAIACGVCLFPNIGLPSPDRASVLALRTIAKLREENLTPLLFWLLTFFPFILISGKTALLANFKFPIFLKCFHNSSCRMKCALKETYLISVFSPNANFGKMWCPSLNLNFLGDEK